MCYVYVTRKKFPGKYQADTIKILSKLWKSHEQVLLDTCIKYKRRHTP